ncbi:MAG: HNH endonuclease domain-containing protein [Verrucomicrobiia bacterium]
MILSFNWGKNSIGWSLLRVQPNLELLGTGAVTFSLNSCMAAERRNHRRQRRHIRSTRQRIVGIKNFLKELGIFKQEELNQPGCAWPWLLAARVLKGGELLSWPELWDVLRWYAHNRGYDGNRRWSYLEKKVYVEDSQKEKNAWEFMKRHNTSTMAETFCAELGLNPLKDKKASYLTFKNHNAAFPRKVVEAEMRRILEAHIGHLPQVNQEFIRTLIGEGIEDKKAWQTLPQANLHLPNRFEGGLLFGQLVARFDNRDRTICPITYPRLLLEAKRHTINEERAKIVAAQRSRTPHKNCPEFYRYRWATLLSRIQIKEAKELPHRFLNQAELKKITELVQRRGHFTVTQFKKAVRSVTSANEDNLDRLFHQAELAEALIVDPIQKLETSNRLSPLWSLLPECLKKRIRGQWRRGHAITLEQIRTQLQSRSGAVDLFDQELKRQLQLAQHRRRKRESVVELEDLLQIKFYPEQLTGRSPYARSVMKEVADEIMQGKQPQRPGGCLSLTPELRQAQVEMPLSFQTKSHWVQHRMLLLERLVKDIIETYADGNFDAIKKVIFKVDHPTKSSGFEPVPDLNEKSESEEWQRLMKKLQLDAKIKDCKVPITAEIIRKACIAEDLGWRCPYTGEKYQPIDLVLRKVDKDYIAPDVRSFSESLDSLVLTFTEIHNWKGKRSAAKFVEEEAGKPVPNLPHLSITSPSNFKRFVENLETIDEDFRNRQHTEISAKPRSNSEFSAFETTQSFSLTQIGARVIARVFHNAPPPIVTFSQTALEPIQKQWNLESYLTGLCPQVQKDEQNISRFTYLTRAIKACSQGLFSYYASQVQHSQWDQKLRFEKKYSFQKLPSYVKEQLIHRLLENRVVQHLPARMDGLKVEQNIWRVVSRDKQDQVALRQRNLQSSKLFKKEVLHAIKLLGLDPEKEPSKLKSLKGALIVRDNFGIAVGSQAVIVPFHKVWLRLQTLKESCTKKRMKLLRNGQIIHVPRERQRKISRWGLKGTWRIFSVKNNRGGIALDLGYVDAVKAHMINIALEALLKAGAYPVKTNLVGNRVTAKKRSQVMAVTA